MNRKLVILPALAAVSLSGAVFAQQSAAEMAQVQAIMNKSHQIQSQRRMQEAQTKAGANYVSTIMNDSHAQQQLVNPVEGASKSEPAAAATTTVAPTAANSQETIKALETQLSQLNQSNLLFQQQTDRRMDALNGEHDLLQHKLAQVNQVLGILSKEVTELSQQIGAAQRQLKSSLTPEQQQQMTASSSVVPTGFMHQIESNKPVEYVLYAIMALLVVVILMLIPRRRGSQMQMVTETVGSAAANDVEESDTKDEYDFMGSDEAIPAKLDLARAYIAMEDYKAAKQVLAQVTTKGNTEQQAEAQNMLDKIPAPKG